MDHPVTTLLSYCTRSDWVMDETILSQMSNVVERHINGQRLDTDEIAAIVSARDERIDDRKFEMSGATAIIPVTGIIAKHSSMVNGCSQPEGTSVETMREQLMSAMADPRVESIFLLVDSPGGCIDGLADFADEVYEASFQKPIVAYADDLCASAAYWIASQANLIYSNRTTDVGSIGVYTLYVDSTQRAENEGLKFHIFRSGSNKGVGSPGVEITEENAAVIQERIDAKFEIFLDAIMQGRAGSGMDKDDLRALADGRCYVGQTALDSKLIDGIKTIPQAIAAVLPSVRTNKSVAAVASAEKNQLDSVKEQEMAKETENKVDASAAAKIASDAKAAETVRIQGITSALAGDDFADLRTKAITEDWTVDKAKAEAFEVAKTAGQEKVKEANAQAAVAQGKLDAIASGGNDAVAAASSDEKQPAAKAEGDSNDPDTFTVYRDKLEDSGKSPGEAIKAAAKRYPDSHDAWVAAQPKSTAK